MEPLLFTINTLDIFFEQKDVKFAAYANDDNTLYICNKNFEVLLSKLKLEQFDGYQNIWKPICKPHAFTLYKAFFKRKKRSGTSLLASFSHFLLVSE